MPHEQNESHTLLCPGLSQTPVRSVVPATGACRTAPRIARNVCLIIVPGRVSPVSRAPACRRRRISRAILGSVFTS